MACNIADAPAPKNGPVVVAAIDFGTTFSGYAWSFSHEKDRIFVSTWNGRARSGGKVPTILLLEPDKTFHSFGYDAREKYVDLLDEEDELAKEWFYFDRFKMKLYETKKLRRDVQLAAVNGRKLPAVDVFAIVIDHLKQELEKELKLAYAGAQPEDILWVLTVPAIWSDSAKQFMREAANKAGIDNKRLKLVLEPEAAALYCNSQKSCRVAKADGSFQMEALPEGHKYIVADLGGGTADLAVHEILPGGNIREIRRSDGDALGGNLVNEAFAEFLQDVFGKNIIEIFDREHKGDVIELNEEFEKKKAKLTKDMNAKITFKLPKTTLSEIASQLDGGTFTEISKAAQERYENKVSFNKGDKMFIQSDIIERFFKAAVDGILIFIKKMREEDELNEINTLLLVGGFSESEYVKQAVQATNPGMKIIVPPEPSLSVLKGAVLMGHNPKTIKERVARFTYGFSCARPFRKDTDPEKLKVERGGQTICRSVFKTMIEKGRVLKVGDSFHMSVTHVCTDLSDTHAVLSSVLYKSDELNPKYSTEEYGCEEVGRVSEHPPEGGWPPYCVFLEMLVVGETEFDMVIMNTANESIVDSKLDFL